MRFVIAVLAAVLSLQHALAETPANWPQFRGPNGDGISQATGLPVTWSESEHVKWKTAIHGRAWSSPVIWNDQIWMTTAPQDGKQLYAVCVDRDSGRIVHDVLVFQVANPQFCYPLNSYGTPTPVIEQGRVWVHFGTHGTACLDSGTGEVLWRREDLHCNHHRGPASSPIVAGNLLVVAFDGFDIQYVVAFDKNTGETVWQRDRNIEYESDDGDVKKAFGTAKVITVAGQKQLVYPSAGATIAYDPPTGRELWRMRHGGMNACMPPIFADGRLYLNSASGGFKLFAMRVGGKGDVTESAVEWKCSQGVPNRSSPILVDDLIFMVSDAGVASCIEAATGKAVRQRRLEGEFSSSPIYSEGHLYFPNQDGKTFVLSADRNIELLATNVLEAGCMASPAVYDKAIFLRTKTHLYRLEQ
jgi:outer membrane protein assembly factor BamB